MKARRTCRYAVLSSITNNALWPSTMWRKMQCLFVKFCWTSSKALRCASNLASPLPGEVWEATGPDRQQRGLNKRCSSVLGLWDSEVADRTSTVRHYAAAACMPLSEKVKGRKEQVDPAGPPALPQAAQDLRDLYGHWSSASWHASTVVFFFSFHRCVGHSEQIKGQTPNALDQDSMAPGLQAHGARLVQRRS